MLSFAQKERERTGIPIPVSARCCRSRRPCVEAEQGRWQGTSGDGGLGAMLGRMVARLGVAPGRAAVVLGPTNLDTELRRGAAGEKGRSAKG